MDLKLINGFVILSAVFSAVHSVEDITKGPPTSDKPWVPGWGWFGTNNPLGWKHRHEKCLNQTLQHKQDIKIVFFGDSKTEGWVTEGHKVWAEQYVKRGGYNYGIGGDSTRQILWRIENHELDGLKPKALVFMIGGNNFGNDYNKGTDEEIVKAEHLIFEKIREKLPKTPIIFVAQLPRGNPTDKRARDINNLWVQELKASPQSYVHVLNPYEKFTNSDGTQNTKLYIGDHIHLNGDGYQLLAESLEPLLKPFLQSNQ